MHLEVSNLSKHFQTRQGPLVALKNINMHVETGEFVCAVGASGSGKSTLLRLVAGLDFPTSGEITVDDEWVIGPGADRGTDLLLAGHLQRGGDLRQFLGLDRIEFMVAAHQ